MITTQRIDETTFSMNDTYNDYIIKVIDGKHICHNTDGERVDNQSFDSIDQLTEYYENLTSEEYDNNNEPKLDPWNAMIKLRDSTKDPQVKQHAQMLLRQRNTAGGKAVESEMITFLFENGITNVKS